MFLTFLLAAVRDAGKQVGLTVTQYDFSEPQQRATMYTTEMYIFFNSRYS